MDTVVVGDFPSFTNARNFEADLREQFPQVRIDPEEGYEVYAINLSDYESHKVEIDRIIRDNGGQIVWERP